MKRYLSMVLLLFVIAATATPSFAQDKPSKEDKKKEKMEKKLWKQKAKDYKKNPLSLRDDLESARKQLADCSEKNKKLEATLAAKMNTIDSLTSLLNQKEAQLSALQAKYDKLQAAYEAEKNVVEKGIKPGLVYRVQVGAYVHFDMNQHLMHTDKSFEGENADGMNKYMMGNFREIGFAESFRDDIRKLGIRDAWVVPYIDGTRVTLEEAKEYQEKQGSGGGDNAGGEG